MTLSYNYTKMLTDFVLQERDAGINFCLLMKDAFKREEQLSFHPRFNQPCWGELRPYSEEEYRPGDLHHPFPDGTPIGLAIQFTWTTKEHLELYKYLLSEESPWVLGIEDCELIIKEEIPVGIVLTDLNIDPTTLVNLLTLLHYTLCPKKYKKLLDIGYLKILAVAVLCCSKRFNLKRFFRGEPEIVSPPLSERGAYKRQGDYPDDIWRDKDGLKIYDLGFKFSDLNTMNTTKLKKLLPKLQEVYEELINEESR